MSQPPSYEFEEDDAPKPERKKFIPGLTEAPPVPVSAPVSPAPPAAPSAPGSGSRAAAASPGSASRPRPAAAPVQPAPPVADDPDLKPGSRKDLWPCPHCGTRNNPERVVCRSCNKAPGDARARPFWLRKSFIGGVVGGFAAVLLLWAVTRPDLSLKPVGKASFARGSTKAVEHDLGGKVFTPKGRLSICGRILATRPTPETDGSTDVILLLGAATDEDVAAAAPAFNNQLIENLPKDAQILHLVTSEKFDQAKGAWLSVVGDFGQISDGAQLVRSAEQGFTVAVDQFRQ